MSIETDATRLAMIKAVGGEQFDSGRPDYFWGVFAREFAEGVAGDQVVEIRQTSIECRTSDVAAHRLVKDSVITRVSDGAQYRVKRFEDDGTGMTTVILRA